MIDPPEKSTVGWSLGPMNEKLMCSGECPGSHDLKRSRQLNNIAISQRRVVELQASQGWHD